MKKYTQKALKAMVADGRATHITEYGSIPEKTDVIGMSHGTYGMNGALLLGRESGKLYAITARSTVLFQYV